MTPLILSYCYQERVTATSVGQMFDDLGGAVSYLIAVLMTPHEPAGFPNTTGKGIYMVLGPPGCAQTSPLLEPGSPRFFWWYENSE